MKRRLPSSQGPIRKTDYDQNEILTSCCPRFSASAVKVSRKCVTYSNKEATLANEQHIERDHVEGLIAQNSVKAHLIAFVA